MLLARKSVPPAQMSVPPAQLLGAVVLRVLAKVRKRVPQEPWRELRASGRRDLEWRLWWLLHRWRNYCLQPRELGLVCRWGCLVLLLQKPILRLLCGSRLAHVWLAERPAS